MRLLDDAAAASAMGDEPLSSSLCFRGLRLQGRRRPGSLSGESTGSATLHRRRRQKKNQPYRPQLPGHFISIVCNVSFVLWSSLPCGTPVPSHAQSPVGHAQPPRRPRLRLHSVRLRASTGRDPNGRRTAAPRAPPPHEKFSLITSQSEE